MARVIRSWQKANQFRFSHIDHRMENKDTSKNEKVNVCLFYLRCKLVSVCLKLIHRVGTYLRFYFEKVTVGRCRALHLSSNVKTVDG